MAQTAHTPGPWQAERGFRDTFSYTSGHSTESNTYITIYCGEEAIDSDGEMPIDIIEVHGPNQEANTALIATALDLLDLLYYRLRYDTDTDFRDAENSRYLAATDGNADPMDIWENKARTAIEKATKTGELEAY